MADDFDNKAGGAAEVLRTLERALAVAARRRRLRSALAVAAFLVAATVLVVMWFSLPTA